MAEKTTTFLLLPGVGPHFEPNPDFDPSKPESPENVHDFEVKPGQKVKSRRPLDTLFVNKFRIVGETDRSNRQSAGGDVPGPDGDPDEGRPVRSVEAANVRAADRHASDEELDGKPHLKKAAKGRPVDEDEDEDDDADDEGGDEEEDDGFGEDVTSSFADAAENELTVRKDSEGKYRVFEKGEEEPMEGSKKGFTDKKKVKTFIRKQTGKEE